MADVWYDWAMAKSPQSDPEQVELTYFLWEWAVLRRQAIQELLDKAERDLFDLHSNAPPDDAETWEHDLRLRLEMLREQSARFDSEITPRTNHAAMYKRWTGREPRLRAFQSRGTTANKLLQHRQAVLSGGWPGLHAATLRMAASFLERLIRTPEQAYQSNLGVAAMAIHYATHDKASPYDPKVFDLERTAIRGRIEDVLASDDVQDARTQGDNRYACVSNAVQLALHKLTRISEPTVQTRLGTPSRQPPARKKARARNKRRKPDKPNKSKA